MRDALSPQSTLRAAQSTPAMLGAAYGGKAVTRNGPRYSCNTGLSAWRTDASSSTDEHSEINRYA